MITPETKTAKKSKQVAASGLAQTRRGRDQGLHRNGFLFFDQNDLESIITKVNSGLSYSLFEQLCHKLQVSRTTLANILQFSLSALNRGKTSDLLTPVESERLVRIIRLLDLCYDRLGCEEQARKWLNAPNRSLNWISPLEYAQHEIGARRVEELIAVLE